MDNLIIRLILDAGQFASELDKEEAKIRELDAMSLRDKTVNVDVQDAEAKAELAEIARAESKTVRVDLDDARARARIEEDARDRDTTVRVRVDDAEARARLAEDTKPEEKRVRLNIEGGEGGGLGIGALLSALPMLSPLVATATAGVMGLASAFASATAGVGGFAVVAVPTLKDVFQGTEAVQKAQEAYNNAVTNKQRQEALQKEKEAWASMDAEEQRAARSLMDFQQFFRQFRQSFETPVINAFVNGLQMLRQLLIDMRPVIQNATEAFTELEGEAGRALGSPYWQQFFGFLGSTAKPMLLDFGQAIGNLIKGFTGLLMAFQPLSTGMAQGLLTLTQRFAAWATTLQSSQGFQQFVAYVRANGPLVVQLIGQLATIATQLLSAWAPVGHQLLEAAVSLGQMVSGLLKANPALGTMLGYLVSGIGMFKLFGGAISPIVSGIESLSGVLKLIGSGFEVLSGLVS